ncbi:UNVERIFIED_CONTAM: hypothetical protein Sradi_3162700 [Sesamum radiatum]|uniref:Uncharacterized protein n=1 Tax=Sesamum radiatum TaxID=300843 RepID=A0AAW2REH1_SESRA
MNPLKSKGKRWFSIGTYPIEVLCYSTGWGKIPGSYIIVVANPAIKPPYFRLLILVLRTPCSCADAAFGRALSLKCTRFHHRQLIVERKVCDLRKRLADSSAREQELEAHQASLEAKVKELEEQLARSTSEVAKVKEDAFAQGREEGFSADEAASKIVVMTQGREEFLLSAKYETSIATSRLQGARDFLKSSAFNVAIEIKAANFVNDGFEKCKSQITKLQGFANGFDPSLLDPSLDDNLEPYPEVPEDEPLPDEFDALIADIENMTC